MARISSYKIELKQKKLYIICVVSLVAIVGLFLFFPSESREIKTSSSPMQLELPSSTVSSENIRLAHVEQFHDVLGDRLQSLEKSLLDLREEKSLMEIEKENLLQESHSLKQRSERLEVELANLIVEKKSEPSSYSLQETESPAPFKVWESEDRPEERNTAFEIPAGTVLKAVLVSGADCSVAVQKPTGPNMVLLRPLDNGKLPRNVKVPLKGSIIIGNAIGDISSERVYVRAERLTLVERNGSFVETEVSAYVSGEDGREGLRGIVVDRSGQIITRAAFASFLQGIGQTVEAILNNQTIEKLSEVTPNKTILNLDMFRTSAIQGGATALGKMADYYIKRAEQLQPAIQIAAGRVVDVIFTKTVKIGERDLKKKLDRERELRLKEMKNA